MHTLKLFFITLLFFIVFDYLWLGIIAKPLYVTAYNDFLHPCGTALTFKYPAAIAVYCLLIIGILFFVVPSANGNWVHGLLAGALFGLITYGIFNLTNIAVLPNWPLKISVIDTLWGTTLCGVCGAFATTVDRMLS